MNSAFEEGQPNINDLQQRRSRTMSKLTEIKQGLNDGEENEDCCVKSVTSRNHFNSQLTTIIKEEESSSLGEDTGHLHNITSLSCQIKTEPQSKEQEDGYKLENEAGDNPASYVTKREITEVHTEDHPMMDDEVNHKNRTKDSGTEANRIPKFENDNWSPNIPYNNIDKKKNMPDLTKEMHKQQICGRIAKETEISHKQAKTRTNHKCSVCTKVFCSNQAYLKHMWNAHTGENPYSCEVCGKGFKYLSYLQRHKPVHSDERHYSCDVCYKAFKQKCVLQTHKLSCHSDERPYSCDACRKDYKHKSDLQNHKVLCHSDERPYSCDLCKKTFKLKDYLDKHNTIVHSDKKPYSCDLCKKMFKQKAHLVRHKRTLHSDEKPYSCNLCEKTFKRKEYLDKHRTIVHSDKSPYSCHVCKKMFKQKGHLDRHKRILHSDEMCYP